MSIISLGFFTLITPIFSNLAGQVMDGMLNAFWGINTSRFYFSAYLACFSAPEVSPASMITVAWDNPLMTPSRRGKNQRSVLVAGENCDTTRPSFSILSWTSRFSPG